jgi:glutamyl-Q tRNA(Asp) synthetase
MRLKTAVCGMIWSTHAYSSSAAKPNSALMPSVHPPLTLPESAYRGRFAPSPTGLLHFGSLVAALGSWLRARACAGAWLIRVEDIDPPRERAGASAAILEMLGHFGLESDEPVLYQSRRHAIYREALQRLIDQGDAFACCCTRNDLAPSGIHHGACRRGSGTPAWRLRAPGQVWQFDDVVAGPVQQDSREVGDFVLWRADGLPAYQLAVVVDDHAQRISEVVRGGDLLDSTARQIYLQRRLALPTPAYLHLPLVLDEHGHKLSKSLSSLPLERGNALAALRLALAFLGQPQHPGLQRVDQLLAAAVAQFDIGRIPQPTAAATVSNVASAPAGT